MFLKSIDIKNFRSFDQCSVHFEKDLTVFVGENNGGKSNTIDALRLLTVPIGERKEIYCEVSDVRFQSPDQGFTLTGLYSDLSPRQGGNFINASANGSLNEIRIGLDFNCGQSNNSKPAHWAGKPGGQLEPGSKELIKNVYLPPLRDAKRSLASGNPTRILTLLEHFVGNIDSDQLAKQLARANSHDVLDKIDNAVNKSLGALTAGVRRQSAAIGFTAEETLSDIARDLRFKLGDHGIVPEDLRYSGHGYANLLFMAIIAVELEKVRSSELTIFLVEEPEAHLHPQLQAAVLAFLQEQAERSRKNPPTDNGPAGELQVVVATHSPNLSAWVSSSKLVVFKSIAPSKIESIDASAGVDTQAGTTNSDFGEPRSVRQKSHTILTIPPSRRITKSIPLSEIKLKAVDRRKIDRYLDVTKSALLFGGRILLLEGIAESLLIPAIAKMHTLKDNAERILKFKSTVFIPIDGVDFEPYVQLLLTQVNGARIADRVVVITDGDKRFNQDKQTFEFPGNERKQSLTDLSNKLGAPELLEVITNTYSLEAELIEAGNSSLLRKVFLQLHPKSEAKWDTAIGKSGDKRANLIHDIFTDTRKGDFAQILADHIVSGELFITPSYLKKAIEAIVA